jgi:methionyl-tRNA formyltransferase
MRILLFGMRCRFTTSILATLIESGYDIAAVVLPGRQPARDWRWLRAPGAKPGLPLAGETTVDSLAARHRIPLAELHPGTREPAIEVISALAPDLVVVACFPRLIPDELVRLAPLGGCNVHPSLLPELRGPDPLFWTLHAGLARSGVTIHLLSDRFDAGDIVAQRAVEIPAGERIDRLETVMGQEGGALLAKTLPQWSVARTPAQPQDERLATYAPNPQLTDFRAPVCWPVERAFRFIRGIAPLGVEIKIFENAGNLLGVRDALGWSAEPLTRSTDDGEAGAIEIRFSDGFLRVLPA